MWYTRLVTLVLLIGISRASTAQSVTGETPPAPAGRPAAQNQTVDTQPLNNSLNTLSSSVKPLERIYVLKTNGDEIKGRFVNASETSLTMEVGGQTREIPANDVQRVRRRGGNRVKRGMLFGYLAGAAVGLVATARLDSATEKGAGLFLSLTAAGGTGLGWGGIIGAFVHAHPVVYPATNQTVRFVPAPRGVGVMLSARF